MDTDRRGSPDQAQRARLAQILRDPSAYFAEARREAHQQARRLLATHLASSDGVHPAR